MSVKREEGTYTTAGVGAADRLRVALVAEDGAEDAVKGVEAEEVTVAAGAVAAGHLLAVAALVAAGGGRGSSAGRGREGGGGEGHGEEGAGELHCDGLDGFWK